MRVSGDSAFHAGCSSNGKEEKKKFLVTNGI